MTPRKTAAEIKALIVSQLETSLSTTVPLLPKAFIRVLAKVLGGVFVLLYEHIGFMLLQMFVRTATNEEININGVKLRPLTEWGRLVGIDQDAGQATELEVTIPVLTTGGTVYSGTMALNASTGVMYMLMGDVSLSSSSVTGTIRATEYGEIGNVDVGAVLSWISPPDSIEKDMTVSAVSTDGVDEELVEEYRKRILARWAARPQGGAYADYYDWCMAVTGVKNAYPYSGWDIDGLPLSGSGTIVVFIESKADTDGIPPLGGALLDDVYSAINENEAGLANRRPINAFTDLSLVRPISRWSIDITIGEVSSVDEIDVVKAAINDGLTEFLLDREPYITGLNPPPRKDVISIYEMAGVVSRIVASYGGYFGSISGEISGGDALEPEYVLQEGEKAKLGTITWS